ncbi:triose-phosphate isomerase [uncultured Sphingomonas sp.]|uniref:triose-phosphate isomerase n=1 Tax=uncultured Sphingomonas sp. TaxID=158754 RepID=UPI002588608E|nr:triose-phosphate isomerase [uncultured Sphingomonas sp.]
MTRRKLVAGNWKMNGSLAALAELEAIAAAAAARSDVDVAIAVPATLIGAAHARVPALAIGAQDVHPAEKGAYTGCISTTLAKEAGATFSIVGHSERRADQNESDVLVKAKAEALHKAGMMAIVCVGETLEQRDAGDAEAVVTAQVAGSLPDGAAADWCAIAYEPVWAIGTGRTPTTADVAAMHGAIRATLRDLIGEDADAMRLLYGGSVSGANAAELLHTADVDGALVGGASLTAAAFVPIIQAA